MESVINELSVKAIYVAVIISLIPVAAATVTGLVVAILQTLTQVQEQTLPFFFKMIVTFGALYASSSWAASTLVELCALVFEQMAG